MLSREKKRMSVGLAVQVERDGKDYFLGRYVRLLLGFWLPWERMNIMLKFLATISSGWLEPLLLSWTVGTPALDLQLAIAFSNAF